jgi:hypothetical protein
LAPSKIKPPRIKIESPRVAPETPEPRKQQALKDRADHLIKSRRDGPARFRSLLLFSVFNNLDAQRPGRIKKVKRAG